MLQSVNDTIQPDSKRLYNFTFNFQKPEDVEAQSQQEQQVSSRKSIPLKVNQ